MFVACILLPSKEKVVVPISWFSSFDLVQIFNRGKNSAKVHKIFYYKDKSVDPNFRLPVRRDFDENVRACYNANALFAFRKCPNCLYSNLCFII